LTHHSQGDHTIYTFPRHYQLIVQFFQAQLLLVGLREQVHAMIESMLHIGRIEGC